jgi:RimJ/RimL family protein N-acetyltransferase
LSGTARPIEFPVEGLTDGRIRLRLLAEADLPAVVAACQDPEIPRWTVVPHDYTDDDARDWLGIAERERSEGNGLPLLIVDAESDELLGSVGVGKVDWDDARGELGYWLAAPHRGRGVMTAAVKLLAAWAFDELALDRLSICAEPENAASCRVAERAGFTYEGVLRSWHLNKDVRRDCAMYSLLRGELG